MSRLETAIEALRLGDLDVHGAWLTRDSNVLKMLAPEYFGSLHLVLRIRGRFEEEFEYLESQGSPVGLNAEIFTAYDMHRGYCLGLLGRYEASRRLLTGAEARALDSCLFDLHC